MNAFRSLPAEILGLVILVFALATKIYFSEIQDFWLALGTGAALFLAMHVRSYLSLKMTAKDKPSLQVE